MSKSKFVDALKAHIPALMASGWESGINQFVLISQSGNFYCPSGYQWVQSAELDRYGHACYSALRELATSIQAIVVRFDKIDKPEFTSAVKLLCEVNAKMLQDDWNVEDGYVIIDNLKKQNANDLGRFLIMLRNMYEHNMYQVVHHWHEQGFAPTVALSLALLFDIGDKRDQLVAPKSAHRAFGLDPTQASWASVKEAIAKNYFFNAEHRTLSARWDLAELDSAFKYGRGHSLHECVKSGFVQVRNDWGILVSSYKMNVVTEFFKKEFQ